MKYKIVCIAQIYNELRKGNLERFLKYTMPLVDALVVYDDASTDGSYEYVLQHTPHVIRGVRNDFSNEISHKQLLLDKALELKPDFILWLDADEVLTANATRERLDELCAYCVDYNLDGPSFHELNLWRSHSWRRIDSRYDDGWFVRLWRVKPGMSFGNPEAGLHLRVVPPCIEKVERTEDIAVIHFGFASKRALAYKYLVYKSHGQRGWPLDRLIDEETLRLEKVPSELFPDGLYVDDTSPQPIGVEDALAYVERYREEVFTPGISVMCLVYKSVKWLRFVYEQVVRYMDLGQNEFFFVANDASEEVLTYLRENYIPHFVWNNTSEQRRQWYINNVYRAWNHAAQVARGDYLLFINSDMAFSPGWSERIFEKLNGHNCVTSRLVESGKLPSGELGIERDFGRTPETYDEAGFVEYAKSIAQTGAVDGGLYMPLLIRRDDFWRVGGYPEGNIVRGTDIFNPVIAKQGGPCVSGDVVLMEKLASIGIRHQTALDSMAYHFQCGEMDERVESLSSVASSPTMILCNDFLTGRMGERTMWDFLLERLPNVAGVDMRVVGEQGDFGSNARLYIEHNYPQSSIIMQNATFIDRIDPWRFTIVYLQDDLRRMGRVSRPQEENLRSAQIIVSNSRFTVASYREYDIRVIPIGVDEELFHPMDKLALRRQYGFPDGVIGIFVGDFSEVKGWSRIRALVEKRKDIFWILVSKDSKSFAATNARTYNRIPQVELAKLLNCADFFVIGSPVETQCLAAIEACMCNIPVVMPDVGIFADWSADEKTRVGYFGNDFEQGIAEVLGRSTQPREVMFEKGLRVSDMVTRWRHLLSSAHLAINNKRSYIGQGAERANTKPILVSVITPAYNRASYLEETIRSVLRQDYPHMEYIVLDDGSTDNTREVLEKHSGRIIWETHPNMGETRTVNKGFAMAHGDIVAVVNSDDPLLPGAVAAAVAFMQSHPDVLVAYPDWDMIGPESELIRHIQVREYDYLYMLKRHHCTPGPGAFIRRRAFEMAGMRDPEFKYVADFDFWLRAGLHGSFARIPKTLATFRMHPTSATSSQKGPLMAEEHIRLIRKIYGRSDLPVQVQRVRREAFGWANFVAAIACGPARNYALVHTLKAIWCHPTIVFEVAAMYLGALSSKLPNPIRRFLRPYWRFARSVLSKGLHPSRARGA